MGYLMNEEELKNLEFEGLTEADEQEIERVVAEISFSNVDGDAIRAFLVQQAAECVTDDRMRAGWMADAAVFADGWRSGLVYMLRWIRAFEENEMLDDPDNFFYFAVKTKDVELMEETYAWRTGS